MDDRPARRAVAANTKRRNRAEAEPSLDAVRGRRDRQTGQGRVMGITEQAHGRRTRSQDERALGRSVDRGDRHDRFLDWPVAPPADADRVAHRGPITRSIEDLATRIAGQGAAAGLDDGLEQRPRAAAEQVLDRGQERIRDGGHGRISAHEPWTRMSTRRDRAQEVAVAPGVRNR